MLHRLTGRLPPTRTERLFQAASLAVFVGFGVWSAWLSYKPANPQWPLLVVLGVGLGGMAAYATIVLGRVVAALRGEHEIDGGFPWRLLFRRSTWDRFLVATALEVLLFTVAAGMMLFSLLDAVRTQSAYSAAVFALLAAMTWWPFIRHRIRHGRWPN